MIIREGCKMVCPYCNSDRVDEHSEFKYHCNGCGRIRHKAMLQEVYKPEEDTKCPDCGSQAITYSVGHNLYICNSCHKTWLNSKDKFINGAKLLEEMESLKPPKIFGINMQSLNSFKAKIEKEKREKQEKKDSLIRCLYCGKGNVENPYYNDISKEDKDLRVFGGKKPEIQRDRRDRRNRRGGWMQ